MNDNIDFRFITRTFSEDYVVLCDNGKRQLTDIEEFAPIRKIGNIIPEEGPCAVLFERNAKIFFAVSGMRRGKIDKAGRPIRFSFCKIYQTNDQNDKERAYNAFVKIITDWNVAEEAIREERRPPLIKIIPAARTSSDTEYAIEFDELSFMDLLENGNSKLDCVDFEYCSDGKFSTDEFTKSFIWPRNGCIFKWTKFDGYVECLTSGDRTSFDFNDFNNNKNANNYDYENNYTDIDFGDLINTGINAMKKISGGVGQKMIAAAAEAKTTINNSIKNLQPQRTMEQDRADILSEIYRLRQKYWNRMDMNRQRAINDALKLLAFALKEK